MDSLTIGVAVLATAVVVLAGMVGWLYVQQTRLFANMNGLVMVIGDLSQRIQVPVPTPEPVPEPVPEPEEEEEDDRASVVDKVEAEIVDGPPLDTDGLESKTKKELQEILTKRGIPFGKADAKSVLVSLLKATA
uniref:HeH/LEM domain-containing protein n=1 Tax=viral metagenome TaxID=1070528 RepID=A0A6C0M0H3_9ZZZZ